MKTIPTFSIYLCPDIITNLLRQQIIQLMGRLGVTEILIILLVVLLLFGGKKIPELMKGLGSGINEFKKAAKGEEEEQAAKKSDETKE